MKIAYLSSSIVPSKSANSIHVMKMCQALSQNNHTIKLFAINDSRYIIPNINDVYSFYGVDDIFKIKYIKKNKLPFIRRYLYSYFASRIIKNDNFDLVYSRDFFGTYILTKLRKDVVYECHNPNFNFLDNIIFKKIIKNEYLKAIIVISESLKNILIDKYKPLLINSKIIVAHDGVDFDKVDKRISKSESKKLIEQDSEVIIGYSGHLYKGRGIELILELAKLNSEYLFLIIGGNKNDIDKYKNIANEMDIRNILFMGYISNNVLFNYMSAVDILLMPYQNNVKAGKGKANTSKFMSPLKMFEYLALGKPIISSDLPVLKEVLIDNYNCLMAPPGDIQSWNVQLNKLVCNKDFRKKIAAQAKIDSKQYSWKLRAKKILNEILEEENNN